MGAAFPLEACTKGRFPPVGGSSAGTEAAARRQTRASAATAGSGEYRHLTRRRGEYAPGKAGQGGRPKAENLPGLPHGECGVWGGAPRFSGHRDGPSMARQGHRVAASSTALSSGAVQGLREATRSVAMAGGLGACPQGFQAGSDPLNNLIQGNKVRQAHLMRVSGRLSDLWRYRPTGLSALLPLHWIAFFRAAIFSLLGGCHART